jgi:hypothetical protein
MVRPVLGPPPTIAHMRFMGVYAVFVSCLLSKCLGTTSMRKTFDELRLPDDTPFTEIASRAALRCRECGSSQVEVRPEWEENETEISPKTPVVRQDSFPDTN